MASARPSAPSPPMPPRCRCANASARSRASVSISTTPSAPRPPTSGSRSQVAASSVASTRADDSGAVGVRLEPMSTPLEEAPHSLAGDRRLLLKREDVHELGAFKWRGALPSLRRYRERGAEAVVTASTGNHGAATAWAAERTGMRAVVFGPENASRAKVGVMEELGAELHLVGPDLDEAKEHAREFAAERNLPFFEDGAEPAQFDGYRAITTEILEQLGEPPAAVVVPVGNGALLIGIARGLPVGERIGVVA